MIDLDDLKWRNLVQDISDERAVRELKDGDGFYLGNDPSGPSLHHGHLVPFFTLLRLAKAGLKPVLLFGGSTGLIGDPKPDTERPMISLEQVRANVEQMSACVKAIVERLDSKIGAKIEFVDNYDWTHGVSVLEFLRDVGKHFTVNYMCQKDKVKKRLESEDEGISYAEFSYMLLQAFDFYHLHVHHGVRLQIGGSDQWGNITAGLELIRKKGLGGSCAFSVPLIVDSQGRKYGKSEGNAVYIDAKLTSPYRFHQFLLNTPDDLIKNFLRMFTFFDREKILELEAAATTNAAAREAQRALADHVCGIIHGESATADAKRSADVLFGGSVKDIPLAQLEEIFRDVPSSSIPASELAPLTFADLLVRTKLAPSKGEARKLVQNGGAYLNNERVGDAQMTMGGALETVGSLFILRSGKKNYHLVRIG